MSSTDSETAATSHPPPPSMLTATHGPVPPAMPDSAPNISIREYIYFLPYPLPPDTPVPYSIHLPAQNPLNLPPHQFEPTSTLVLTSPAKTFLDIRLYKPRSTHAPTPLPNAAEPQRLEWAFAGTSASTPTPHDAWTGVTHATWTHWVDSRYAVGSPDVPVDEGDMFPVAPGLTLEHGHAFHPDLQAVKTHEEMWRDVDAVATGEAGTKICVVLRVQADEAGVRGVVVRVGQFCQGMVMQRERVSVERWEADVGAEGEEVQKWKRTARVGDHFLPCAVTFRPELLAVGGVVQYHDYEWTVEEVWEWN